MDDADRAAEREDIDRFQSHAFALLLLYASLRRGCCGTSGKARRDSAGLLLQGDGRIRAQLLKQRCFL